MKKFTVLILSIIFVFAFVGCNDGDHSSDLESLNRQIQELQAQIDELENSSDTTELEKQLQELQNLVNELKTTNDSYQQTLDTISEKINTMQSDISTLRSQLEAANARLTALEAALNTEPVICEFGDTYTLSNNGIDLFSITFHSFEPQSPQGIAGLEVTITNHHMPECPYSNYLGGYAISNTTTYDYSDKSKTIIKQGHSLEHIYIMFCETNTNKYPDPSELNAIYFGVSTGTSTDSSMIPFAILRMNGAQI